MQFGGFDQERLGAVARAVWERGGPDALVSVLPIGRAPDPGRPIGRCTAIRFLLGLDPAEIGRLLGGRAETELVGGAVVYAVSPLPAVGEFELIGYALPIEPEGVRISGPTHPIYPPGFGAPRWELRVTQSRLATVATVTRGAQFRYEPRGLRPAVDVVILPPVPHGDQPCPAPVRPRASRTRSSTRPRRS